MIFYADLAYSCVIADSQIPLLFYDYQ